MEPGTLELQIFVSLIVILGTAFVALVCDYLKGNNEQLREHNIELRVRKEEQDRNKPQEAVEWLQHLLGATQRNPVRLGSVRPQARHSHGAAGTRTGVRPAAAAGVPQTAAVAQPQPAPAAASVAAVAATAGRVTEERSIEMPAAPAADSELAAATPGRANQEEERPRASRLAAGRARRRAGEEAVTPSLLDSLPVPAWLKKEQDEKAAARAHREEQGQPTVEETPTAAASNTGSTQEIVAEHNQGDRAWTYRGLLDRVVAATGSGREGREEAAGEPPAVQQIHLMEAVGGRQSGHIVSTVAVDVPSHPEGIETSKTLETQDQPTVATVLKTWAARIREEEPTLVEVAASIPREMERAVEKTPQLVEASPMAEPVFPELHLPAGFHHRSVLTSCLRSTDFLTGVVVAIGINDYSHHSEKMGMNAMQELMRSVESMLSGLLRQDVDFGCRSAEDEFILVFPNETGPQAQRRLTAISERLWNFQLRSLSSFSVLFSWGAVEVQGETLADAAASASERMYQTKRNRKTISMDAQRRKLAVNL